MFQMLKPIQTYQFERTRCSKCFKCGQHMLDCFERWKRFRCSKGLKCSSCLRNPEISTTSAMIISDYGWHVWNVWHVRFVKYVCTDWNVNVYVQFKGVACLTCFKMTTYLYTTSRVLIFAEIQIWKCLKYSHVHFL